MNAAILACQMLAISHPHMATRVQKYKRDLESAVLKKSGRMKKIGVNEYLKKGPS
jgi:phosphoribosylcarboxyaminoimidazole (NCAIR) mutase